VPKKHQQIYHLSFNNYHLITDNYYNYLKKYKLNNTMEKKLDIDGLIDDAMEKSYVVPIRKETEI